MEFSRQEQCSGVSFPTPRELPDPGIELMSLGSPTLAGGFFTTSTAADSYKMPFITVDLYGKLIR